MKNLFDVAGKVALVTGGSRGIGLMIARQKRAEIVRLGSGQLFGNHPGTDQVGLRKLHGRHVVIIIIVIVADRIDIILGRVGPEDVTAAQAKRKQQCE